MAQGDIPPGFDIGPPLEPPDPTCRLVANLYLPDPLVHGPGPYPGVVGFISSGFQGWSAGGPRIILAELATKGYICMHADIRTRKPPTGLPTQTTDGKYPQQQADAKIGVRYLRSHPLCNGFVASVGGSGSGYTALWVALNGTVGDDRVDACICLSGVTDMGDRNNDVLINHGFIPDVEDYGRSTDPAVLTAESPVANITAPVPPIFFSNGNPEGNGTTGMPYTQFTNFKAALDAAGVTNYLSRTNTGNEHSFATWPEVGAIATTFLGDAFAAWNGGAGGGRKNPPLGLYNLLNTQGALHGFIGDISALPFLTNPDCVGCRIRKTWVSIQPTDAATFDWSEIDDAVTACRLNGKKIGLSISAGCGTPDWVYTTGTHCTKFPLELADQSLEGGTDMSLPWQTGFKTKWQTFITAMAAKYEDEPVISYIVIAGFMQGNELHFIKTDNDLAAADIIAQADGFVDTVDAYIPAAFEIMDMWAAAFPTTQLMLTQGHPMPDSIPDIENTIEAYPIDTYPIQYGLMNAFLKAHPPPYLPGQGYAYTRGYQPLHPAHSTEIYEPPVPDPLPPWPQPLADLLFNGIITKSGKYIEVYQNDLNSSDPAQQAVIHAAKILLIPDEQQPLPPFIDSSSPLSGFVLTVVNIQGGNFTNVTSVLFGGVPATIFVALSDTLIVATVPLTAVTGPITVITPDGSDTDSFFTVETEIIIPPGGGGLRTPILIYPVGGRPPIQKTRPQPPGDLLVITPGNVGSTTATATWMLPTDTGNSPLTAISGFLTGGPGTVSIPGGVNGEQADIAGLTSDTPYTFSLNVSNAYGASDTVTFDFLSDPAVPPPPITEPRGIFVLLEINTTTGLPIWDLVNEPFWTKAYIDGSRYEARWDLIQPTDIDTFVWTDLDAYLAQCAFYNKLAIISVSAGIYQPSWVKHIPDYDEVGPYPGHFRVPWNPQVSSAWQQFVKVMSLRYKLNTEIIAIVASGSGQVVETVLATEAADVTKITDWATQNADFASAADAWLSVARKFLSNYNTGVQRTVNLLTALLKPVPVGTPVKDGPQALNEYVSFVLTNFRNRMGFMAYGLTAATDTGSLVHQLVNDNSMAGFAAGYRFLVGSRDPALDPTQNPDTYSRLLGFQNALDNAVALKAKFIEIVSDDANNGNSTAITAMQDARTAMALNP